MGKQELSWEVSQQISMRAETSPNKNSSILGIVRHSGKGENYGRLPCISPHTTSECRIVFREPREACDKQQEQTLSLREWRHPPAIPWANTRPGHSDRPHPLLFRKGNRALPFPCRH